MAARQWFTKWPLASGSQSAIKAFFMKEINIIIETKNVTAVVILGPILNLVISALYNIVTKSQFRILSN